jgi:demethylmenaquinone methyltransferase/2-methoxy-6-polyprenyl-1,4-benzoquinol methylase
MPKLEVDKSPERVRRMFGQIAGRYDFLNHLLSLGIDHYWRWRTVRHVRPEGPLPILDVCTGTGDLALAFDRAAGRQLNIVAADFCHEMLEIGRRKSAKAGSGGRITFLEADTQSLPLPSNEFQIVSVAFGLRNVSDTDRGLAEMVRVAAPGGRMAVLEFSSPTWQPFKSIYGWYFRNVLPRIGQFLARNSSAAYEYLPESVGQFPQGEALAERMRAAGLEHVCCYPLTLGVATLYVGHKPAC